MYIGCAVRVQALRSEALDTRVAQAARSRGDVMGFLLGGPPPCNSGIIGI